MVPIQYVIAAHGYQSAFLWFGLGQGVVILIVSQFLRAPALHGVAVLAAPNLAPIVLTGSNQQTRKSFKPMETLKTPLFWVMYLMFVLVASGGLVVTAQFASIAADYLFHLGRNLFALPGNLHRRLWPEICRHQCRHALHRQGYGSSSGAFYRLSCGQGRLALRFLDRRWRQRHRRVNGDPGPQAYTQGTLGGQPLENPFSAGL